MAPPDVDAFGVRRRALWYTYDDDQATPELCIDGVTTDHGMLRLYEHAVITHTDAWLLHRIGQLPSWWRLVHEVKVENLTTGKPYRVTWPRVEAATRLRGLTPTEIAHTVAGWRVVKTRGQGEGRVLCVPEQRTTGTMRKGRPDTRIRHREAFTEHREDAQVTIPPPEIHFTMPDLRVAVVGPYVLLPGERIAA